MELSLSPCCRGLLCRTISNSDDSKKARKWNTLGHAVIDLGENGSVILRRGGRSPKVEAPEWGHRGFGNYALLDRPCVGARGGLSPSKRGTNASCSRHRNDHLKRRVNALAKARIELKGRRKKKPRMSDARASSAPERDGDAQGSHHQRLITTWNGLSNPDIEEAPEKAGWPTGASEAWVLVWRRYGPSTPLSYYNVTATLWGYSGQPLESLLGVILVPRHPGGTPSPKPGSSLGRMAA